MCAILGRACATCCSSSKALSAAPSECARERDAAFCRCSCTMPDATQCSSEWNCDAIQKRQEASTQMKQAPKKGSTAKGEYY
eukprot:682168-Prymnesium_polylepis.1